MNAKIKSILVNIFKVGFAVGIVAWMLSKGMIDLDSLKKTATSEILIFSSLSILAGIMVNTWRWQILLKSQGFQQNYWNVLKLSFIGMFFNFVMPGGVGGDVVKGYYLVKDHPENRMAAVTSIFMDRFLGFVFMVFTAFVAIFFNFHRIQESPEMMSVAFGVSAVAGFFIVFITLSLSRRMRALLKPEQFLPKLPLGAKFLNLYECIHAYRNHTPAMIKAFGLCLFSQIFMIGFVVNIGYQLGEELPLLSYIFVVPVGTVVTALPLAPAGIGVGQAAFYYLFKFYHGFETQVGPVAATWQQVISFGWGLVGGYFFLRRPAMKRTSELSAR